MRARWPIAVLKHFAKSLNLQLQRQMLVRKKAIWTNNDVKQMWAWSRHQRCLHDQNYIIQQKSQENGIVPRNGSCTSNTCIFPFRHLRLGWHPNFLCMSSHIQKKELFIERKTSAREVFFTWMMYLISTGVYTYVGSQRVTHIYALCVFQFPVPGSERIWLGGQGSYWT